MEQENIEFLPLGSIVQLKGGVKKIMIIARGAFAVVKGEKDILIMERVPIRKGL